MMTRVAAGFVAVGIAITLAPDAPARAPGGFLGSRAAPAPILHGHSMTAPVARPPGSLPGSHGVFRARAFQSKRFEGRHRFGGWSGRSWYDGGYGAYDYGSYPYDYDRGYGGTGYVEPYETPPPTYPGPAYPVGGGVPEFSQKIIYVLPYRPGCDSEKQKIRGSSGREHSVTIVRC